ncbi:hypothetical protein GZH46_01215 [Fragariocoptes setiger]|uniref:Uncharacterized protein n=1 Tax=Fragariocoptes setiger TaxID=1670756 RepID=A0ABQ7S9Z7_9ACAR|nr:hypothetical protein GZH46_01215 [Fragariocoptes setiger]
MAAAESQASSQQACTVMKQSGQVTSSSPAGSRPTTPLRQGSVQQGGPYVQVPVQNIPIETKYGVVTAHIQGDHENVENRSVFLTVHDIGSNARSFIDFTEHPVMCDVKLRSVFIHLDLMGQQDSANDLGDDYEFPAIKTIGEQVIPEVLDQLKIKLIVGIGEGAGANILVRFAQAHHSRVLGLVLIHLAPAGVGVLERLRSQITTGKRRFSEFSAENIVELHRLGDTRGGSSSPGNQTPETQLTASSSLTQQQQRQSGQNSPPPMSEQQQLMPLYTNRVNNMNQKNIKKFVVSYMNRKELPVVKDLDILLVAGSRSPYINGMQKYLAQCDKEKTSFLKVDHVVDVLTEAPEKLAKSILLFVKGLGFLTSLMLPGIERQRTLSGSSTGSNEESGTLGAVPNIRPHRILERRRTLSMEEYDMPRPRRLITAASFSQSSSKSTTPTIPSPLATTNN